MINNTQDAGSAAALFASLNSSSSSAANTSTAADTQDRFLKLLVTQMKNQDPLNPMDNAQVTSQMAQLSTVTGIDKLNATLQALSDSMMGNQPLQAASMIGHGVLVPGNGVDLSNGNGYGGIELAQSVDDVLGCSVECTVTKGSVLVTLFFDGIQPGEQKTASVTVKMDSPVLNKGQVLGQFKQPVAVASNQEVQLVESKQPNAAIAIFGLIAVLAIAALVARFFIKPE